MGSILLLGFEQFAIKFFEQSEFSFRGGYNCGMKLMKMLNKIMFTSRRRGRSWYDIVLGCGNRIFV